MGTGGFAGTRTEVQRVSLSCSLTVYTNRSFFHSPGQGTESGRGAEWGQAPLACDLFSRDPLAAAAAPGRPGSPRPRPVGARQDRRASPGLRQGGPGPHAA